MKILSLLFSCFVPPGVLFAMFETSLPVCWPCGTECVDNMLICDGIQNCKDNSDEGESPGEGCNLYPLSGCPSSGGVENYKCDKTGVCFNRKSEAEKCESEGDMFAGLCCTTGDVLMVLILLVTLVLCIYLCIYGCHCCDNNKQGQTSSRGNYNSFNTIADEEA